MVRSRPSRHWIRPISSKSADCGWVSSSPLALRRSRCARRSRRASCRNAFAAVRDLVLLLGEELGVVGPFRAELLTNLGQDLRQPVVQRWAPATPVRHSDSFPGASTCIGLPLDRTSHRTALAVCTCVITRRTEIYSWRYRPLARIRSNIKSWVQHGRMQAGGADGVGQWTSTRAGGRLDDVPSRPQGAENFPVALRVLPRATAHASGRGLRRRPRHRRPRRRGSGRPGRAADASSAPTWRASGRAGSRARRCCAGWPARSAPRPQPSSRSSTSDRGESAGPGHVDTYPTYARPAGLLRTVGQPDRPDRAGGLRRQHTGARRSCPTGCAPHCRSSSTARTSPRIAGPGASTCRWRICERFGVTPADLDGLASTGVAARWSHSRSTRAATCSRRVGRCSSSSRLGTVGRDRIRRRRASRVDRHQTCQIGMLLARLSTDQTYRRDLRSSSS